MLKKSPSAVALRARRIFYFFSSLIITVVVGYFSWSAVISVGGNFVNKVLSYTDKIRAEFFPASVSNSVIEEIVLAPEVVLTDFPATATEVVPIVESVQDQLDDIQEKLDIISQQVQALIAENSKDEDADQEELKTEEEDLKEYKKTEETVVCTGQININTASIEDLDKIIGVGSATAQKIIEARPFYSLNDLLKVSGIGEKTLQKITEQGCAYVDPGLVPPDPGGTPSGGGGNGGVVADTCSASPEKSILISEFQVEGETVDDDWVELYNPNDETVCLSSWSIQKASSTGNISRIKIFSNSAAIPAKGYFLVANNKASQEILDLADMTASGLQLSSEFAGGNTIYLVRKKDEISSGSDPDIIDKVGYGLAKDFKILPALKPSAGHSTGRVWDENLQEYKNTDNNSADFEIDKPTPKGKNEEWVEPPAPTPSDETAPIITLTGDPEITINIGDTYVDAGATALDDIDGDITANITVANSVNAGVAGDYTITYNVSDAAGNNAVEVTRLVHVVVIPPLSSDATVTSAVYAVSSLTDGAGTITNVPFGTSKVVFLDNLIFAVGSLQNTTSSNLGDPIVSGDTFVVTAQDGTTEATYTINIIEPILPKNLLLNEFFDDGWEETAAAGNPVNWTWGKRGGLDLEDLPLVIGKRSFYHEPYSSYYDLTQLGKTLETGKTYYAEIWVSGTGKVKLGIDHSGITKWLSVAYADFNSASWTKMAFSVNTTTDTDNGGIRIRMTRSVATGEKLVIGAAWLGFNPPPENWLNSSP